MALWKGLAVLAMPVLLTGCFAMQKDLDPMRSDISVLEKQFVDLQREAARAKYSAGEGQAAPAGPSGAPSDSNARINAIEKRLDALEAQIRDLRQSQPATAPQPMAPEPVVVEPIGEAPPTGGQTE